MRSFLAFLLLSAAARAAEAPPKIDPAKPVSVSLPVQDWQIVINSVAQSEQVSARDANRITQSIVSQAQPQLAPAQPAKK